MEQKRGQRPNSPAEEHVNYSFPLHALLPFCFMKLNRKSVCASRSPLAADAHATSALPASSPQVRTAPHGTRRDAIDRGALATALGAGACPRATLTDVASVPSPSALWSTTALSAADAAGGRRWPCALATQATARPTTDIDIGSQEQEDQISDTRLLNCQQTMKPIARVVSFPFGPRLHKTRYLLYTCQHMSCKFTCVSTDSREHLAGKARLHGRYVVLSD
jgi:hypothetical protein